VTDAGGKPGDLVRVRIIESATNSLAGRRL